MNIDITQLKQDILAFQNKIAPAWSEESAYKIPEILEYGPYISGGQCAVTCLVLLDVLRETHPQLKIYLAGGRVEKNSQTIISTHNWLKIGEGADAIIVDPTASQAKALNDSVVVASVDSLNSQGISYIEEEVIEGHGEQLHPKRFKRYQILKQKFEELAKENG